MRPLRPRSDGLSLERAGTPRRLRLVPLPLAATAALLLLAAVASQARRRERVVPERLDDVAKTAWSLPVVAASSHAEEISWMCYNGEAEEDTVGPLTIREECPYCSFPPKSWCERSTITVMIRPSAARGDDAPWSTPAGKVTSSTGIEVRRDAGREEFVAIANGDYFDDEAWAPYRVELPANPLYEPMSNVHAVTFRTEKRHVFKTGRDAFALVSIAVSIAFALLASRAPRALPLAAAVGVLAVAVAFYALVTSS